MNTPGPVFWRRAVALLAIALVFAVGCAPAQQPQPAAAGAQSPSTSAQPTVATSTPTVTSEALAPYLAGVADVVAKVEPSVVSFATQFTAYDIFNQPQTEQGEASGWILTADGLIVTNNHVVENADTIKVTLSDGRTFDAKNVYADPLTDLAVVKIDATGLPAADVGDSSSLRVGDTVVAIGNSLGMGISATAGIASALGVSLQETAGQTLLDLIQTDAAINPGNSGGPLVNMAGQVVGINSVKISQVGVEGMGYAISINEALPIINALIQNGRVVRPWMGVGIYTVSAPIAQQYGLAVDSGVLITQVVSGSPAATAGFQAGDVIVQFGGVDTPDAQTFTDALLSHSIGDKVDVTYYRGSSKKTTSVTLGQTPASSS